MSLQSIAQSLRGTRDRTFNEIADALRDIANAFSNVYRDMGWFSISEKSSGLKKDLLVTPQLNVTAANGTTVAARLYSEGNSLILQLVGTNETIIRDINFPIDVLVSSGSISIVSRDPAVVSMLQLLGLMYDNGDYFSTISATGGLTAGQRSSLFGDFTKTYGNLNLTFVDAVDGNSEINSSVTASGGAELNLTKGASNSINMDVSALAVTLLVEDGTHDTTIKPASVATPRLGVGVTPPATDGHAVVDTFLGAGSTAPSSTEKLRVGGNARVDTNLGVGMNPTKALDVTGDGELTGTLEVGGNVTLAGTLTISPLAAGDVLVGQVGGTLSTIDAATARFFLDVYTKAEVDAAIAAAIAAIVVDNALIGTPEEHSHSLS